MQAAADAKAHVLACYERIRAELSVSFDNALIVWDFAKAPACLRELSLNGGDEDWLIYVRPGVLAAGETPMWIDRMDYHGNADRFDLPDGSAVIITAHA